MSFAPPPGPPPPSVPEGWKPQFDARYDRWYPSSIQTPKQNELTVLSGSSPTSTPATRNGSTQRPPRDPHPNPNPLPNLHTNPPRTSLPTPRRPTRAPRPRIPPPWPARLRSCRTSARITRITRRGLRMRGCPARPVAARGWKPRIAMHGLRRSCRRRRNRGLHRDRQGRGRGVAGLLGGIPNRNFRHVLAPDLAHTRNHTRGLCRTTARPPTSRIRAGRRGF